MRGVSMTALIISQNFFRNFTFEIIDYFKCCSNRLSRPQLNQMLEFSLNRPTTNINLNSIAVISRIVRGFITPILRPPWAVKVADANCADSCAHCKFWPNELPRLLHSFQGISVYVRDAASHKHRLLQTWTIWYWILPFYPLQFGIPITFGKMQFRLTRVKSSWCKDWANFINLLG